MPRLELKTSTRTKTQGQEISKNYEEASSGLEIGEERVLLNIENDSVVLKKDTITSISIFREEKRKIALYAEIDEGRLKIDFGQDVLGLHFKEVSRLVVNQEDPHFNSWQPLEGREALGILSLLNKAKVHLDKRSVFRNF